MEPIIGAVIAGTVAWLSILAAVSLPGGRLPTRPVKVIGGLAIALLGLMVVGVSLPSIVPLVFLGGGILGVWLTATPQSQPGLGEVNDVEQDKWLRYAAPEPQPEEAEETVQGPWP